MNKTIHFIITRQAGLDTKPYQEEFKIPYRANMNVISVLMEIQKNPVTADGKKTTPVVWESVCLEEVCGACSMLINGKPQQACSTLIDELPQPIHLAPLKAFPLVRDLMVDRAMMFAALKRVKAWITIDGTHDLDMNLRMKEKDRQFMYQFAKCMTCGCCLEVCPNVNNHSSFIGPAALAQTLIFNNHPSGVLEKEERLNAIMKKGGIAECGNAQNCVRACPKEIPLTTALAELGRQTTVQSLKNFFFEKNEPHE